MTNEEIQSLEEPIGNFQQLNIEVSKMRMGLLIQKLQYVEAEIELALDELMELTK